MKVSIITPVFNGMRFFPETLACVDDLNYENYEHIVIDDCSTDGTFEKLKDDNPRRQWFKNEINLGEAATVNKAYELATGELILVLNADDLIHPDILKEVVSRFRENVSLDVVYPDWRMIDEDGDIIQVVETPEFNGRTLFEDFTCIPGPGAIFKNKLISPLRDVQYKWAGDYDQWLRISNGQNFERIPLVLASWRKHSGAQTHQRGLAMAKERVLLIQNAFLRENSLLYDKNSALGSAYYFAARLVFFDKRVPSTKWLLKSFALRPKRIEGSSFKRPVIISILLAWPVLLPIVRMPFRTFPALEKVISKFLGAEFSRRLSDAVGNLE
jgi:glycosyltransferase involved in cell wall biosynthesis